MANLEFTRIENRADPEHPAQSYKAMGERGYYVMYGYWHHGDHFVTLTLDGVPRGGFVGFGDAAEYAQHLEDK